MHGIVCEMETRKPDRDLEDVSSFEDLPAVLKEQLHNLSELAFKGVMQNKIVFTQKELTSLSTLGLLHSVQGFGSIGRKLVSMQLYPSSCPRAPCCLLYLPTRTS